MNFKQIALDIAEIVDAWRIIPRVILVLYSTLVFQLYLWYKSIPTYVQEQCDSDTLRVLLDAAEKIDLTVAKGIACTVSDIVGGPTAAQSAFVTTIIGLSTGIYGLYVATGRRWDGSKTPDYPYPPRPPYNPPYNPPNRRFDDDNTGPRYTPDEPS